MQTRILSQRPVSGSRSVPTRKTVVTRAGDGAGSLAQGREWVQSLLSKFGPAVDRAQNITTLEFEKPLLELDKRIKEVRGTGIV